MTWKHTENELYALDLDEKCDYPVTARRMLSDHEFDYPEPNHFRWHYRERIKNSSLEFSGHGTLSPIESTVLLLYKASKKSGGYVRMKPEYSYCPFLSGSNNEPVFLYQVVEVIDEVIDYDEIKEELPTLSIGQISGAIAFLRKVAQFNSDDVDLDELEDLELAQDTDFIEELRAALADQETMRVLDFQE